MHKPNHLLIILIALLNICSLSSAVAQLPLSEYNQAYNYNPLALTNFHHFVYRDKQNLRVYLNIRYRSENSVMEDSELSYFFVNSLNSLDKSNTEKLNNSHFVGHETLNNHFTIPLSPKVDTGDIMVIKMATYDKNFTFYHCIPLEEAVDFLPMDGTQPFWGMTDNFIPEKAFQISTADPNAKVTVRHWKDPFLPSLPPMSKTSPPKELATEDKTFDSGATIPIKAMGTYFISLNPDQKEGWIFMKQDKYYPKIKKVEDLAPPLRYISTNDEYKALLVTNDRRKAFEEFWLSNSRSPKRAKSTIKRYYNQVEFANTFFTTYKEGWKTDRGMVYIVFGKPDEVYLHPKDEIWVYGRGEEEQVRFVFEKNTEHYKNGLFMLKRAKKYQDVWFRQVDLWRKGLKGI
ncbi:GWxTD domain-containing protein [Persicobacter psychrovividus]|uniref:GWxTD domain-containing protein n=1 Tax=Persicobacter psychrovividus TaxID=387638 RepID=A0ABM7VBB4_9BACT|nr:hypothetical protein PEPS_04930 [Persicobacter psychrovividus]